jgi:ribosome biogenesis GTPase
MTGSSEDGPFEAEVIAAYGRHLLVRNGGGRGLRARPSGRRLSIVCGDRVRCEIDHKHDEVLIVEVLPRRTLLARASMRGDSEPVVANITRLVVVLAPLPRPDLFIVDRYLCAATAAGITGAVAVNKSDLEDDAQLRDELDALTAAGYERVRCSAKGGQGLDERIESDSRISRLHLCDPRLAGVDRLGDVLLSESALRPSSLKSLGEPKSNLDVRLFLRREP